MPVRRPRRRRAVRDRQRRRQDVRHDGLARRVDDRPAGRDQGGDELPEPRHVERVQRRPAGGAGRGERRPRARSPRCVRRSSGAAHDALDAVGDRRRDVPRAAGRVLLLPERQWAARPRPRRPDVLDDARARRPRAVGGQGGVRPRRGVRRRRATPGSPSPSATTTSPRASADWRSSPPHPDQWSTCCCSSTCCWAGRHHVLERHHVLDGIVRCRRGRWRRTRARRAGSPTGGCHGRADVTTPAPASPAARRGRRSAACARARP